MKFAASLLLLSVLATASPISTTEPTVTVTSTTTHTLYTTVCSACPASAVSSSSLETSSVSKSSSQSVATSSATPESFAGDGTWYDTGLGACGWVNTDQDYIVAIGHGLFDQYTPAANPNDNTLCGKKIRAHYEGKSVEVTAVDRCEGCKPYDIDFSPAAFSQLADQSLGRIKITWEWI